MDSVVFHDSSRFFEVRLSFQIETFEKCTILVKVKEDENSNPPDHHRDKPEYTVVFRGLEFESDAEIEQKGVFFKGLKM